MQKKKKNSRLISSAKILCELYPEDVWQFYICFPALGWVSQWREQISFITASSSQSTCTEQRMYVYMLLTYFLNADRLRTGLVLFYMLLGSAFMYILAEIYIISFYVK